MAGAKVASESICALRVPYHPIPCLLGMGPCDLHVIFNSEVGSSRTLLGICGIWSLISTRAGYTVFELGGPYILAWHDWISPSWRQMTGGLALTVGRRGPPGLYNYCYDECIL